MKLTLKLDTAFVTNMLRFVWIAALVVPAFARAAEVSGKVMNGTTGKPALGAEVVLIDVSADMKEVARTRSNASGRFQFHVQLGGVPHMARVTYGGVSYHSVVSAGDGPLELTVFNSTDSSADIRAAVQAMRIEAAGERLRVTQMLTLANSSSPQRTVQKQELFWLAIPAGTAVLASAAQTPDGTTVDSVAVSRVNEGRCYFSFPLRPGITKLQVQYEVSASGTLTFTPHIPFLADTFGVVLPASMRFEPSQAGTYLQDTDQNGDTAEVIRGAAAGDTAGFTVSAATSLALNVKGDQTETKGERPGWISSRLFLALVPGSGVILLCLYLYRRRSNTQSTARHQTSVSINGDSIREELFNLELARVESHISKGRYAKLKAGLEKRLAAALAPGRERL